MEGGCSDGMCGEDGRGCSGSDKDDKDGRCDLNERDSRYDRDDRNNRDDRGGMDGRGCMNCRDG